MTITQNIYTTGIQKKVKMTFVFRLPDRKKKKKCVIFKPMNNVNTITLYNIDIQVEIKYFSNVEIR